MRNKVRSLIIVESATGCLEALEQCRAVTEGLGGARFASPIGRHASVGAHVRHCLDHFDCFFEGLALGTVDYDARVRRAAWETDVDVALAVMADFAARLGAIQATPGALAGRGLTVWQSVASGTDMRRASPSSVERELAFLSSHTIHHVALMRALIDLAGWDDAAVGEAGVAFSTRAHQAAHARH